MKRLALCVPMIMALAMLSSALPGVARANSDPNEFAVGGGFENYGAAQPIHFAFSAHCQGGTSGVPCTTASGYVVLHNVQGIVPGTFGDISGPVSCLNVAGSSYDIVFTVKNSTIGNFPSGDQVTIWGSGNPPGNGTNATDTLSFLPFYDCSVLGTATPITSGNIVVRDPVLSFAGCPALTDNVSYEVNTSCNLYTNTGTTDSPTWTLAG